MRTSRLTGTFMVLLCSAAMAFASSMTNPNNIAGSHDLNETNNVEMMLNNLDNAASMTNLPNESGGVGNGVVAQNSDVNMLPDYAQNDDLTPTDLAFEPTASDALSNEEALLMMIDDSASDAYMLHTNEASANFAEPHEVCGIDENSPAASSMHDATSYANPFHMRNCVIDTAYRLYAESTAPAAEAWRHASNEGIFENTATAYDQSNSMSLSNAGLTCTA